MYIGLGTLPMKRVVTVIAFTGVICVGAQALAVDLTNPPAMNKRQMFVQVIGCMKKRMSANKSSSYDDAMKVCKDQISKQSDSSSSGALVASAAPAKP